MAAVGDLLAGKAFIELFLDDKEALRGLRAFSNQFRALGNTMQSIGRSMVMAGAAVTAPVMGAARAYAEFSREMAYVSTVLHDSSISLAEFGHDVQKLSLYVGESTDTIAKGLYEVLQAAVAPEDAMEILHIAAKSAKAGWTDTAKATAALIAVMHSYGLEAKDVGDIADILFTVVERGIITFGDLAGHIGLVAPAAAACNVSLNDLGVALILMTQAGVQADHAVIALNNILMQFRKPSAEGAETARQFGAAIGGLELSLAGLARQGGLLGFIQKLGGLPPEAVGRMFPTLRALRGLDAILIRLQHASKESEALLKNAGALDRAFEKFASSFAMVYDRAKVAIQLMAIKAGEGFAETFREMAKNIQWAALGLGDWIKRYASMIGLVIRTIPKLLLLGAAFLFVGKTIALISTVILALMGPTGFGKLMAMLGSLIAVTLIYGRIATSLRAEMAKARGKMPIDPGDVGASYARKRQEQLKKDLTEARKEISGILARPGVSKEQRAQLASAQALERQLEKQLERYSKINVAETKRLEVQRKQNELKKQELDLMNQTRGLATYISGYWHFPEMQLALATAGGADDEISLLGQIRDNTSAGGDINKSLQQIAAGKVNVNG